MELRQLRHFVTIVEVGTFSRAADHLNLTQSALTHSIKALEKLIGFSLLDRGAAGAKTTRAGAALYEQAKLLLSDADRIQTEVQRAAAGLAGTIKLGVSPLFTDIYLPEALSTFAQRYDRLSIHMHEGDIEETVPLLVAGQIDLIISPVPISSMQTNLSYERLGSVRWEFFSSDNGSAGQDKGKPKMGASEMRSQRWALLDCHHEIDFLARYFAVQDQGMPEDAVRTSSMAVMRSLIVNCGMIGLMPVPYMAGTTASPLQTVTPGIVRPFGLISRPDHKMSLAAKEFIEIFRAILALDPEGHFNL